MKQQPLSQTNVFLRDPKKRRQALLRSVITSSAVEGITLTTQELARLQRNKNSAKTRSGSAQ